MEISQIIELALSDNSVKFIGLMIMFDMRAKFTQMKSAVENLTERLGALEERQTVRFERLEDRVEKIEQTKPKEG